MLKNYFTNLVEKAAEKAFGFDIASDFTAVCEKPKNPEFGDFAINVSALAKTTKKAPPLIAQEIAGHISLENFEVNIVAGFINFKVKDEILLSVIKEILQRQKNYGANETGKGQKINLEYVSANPTGPFHIGHGRWAAVGSCLASVLKFSGYEVYQEFYINDAGGQIQKLGKSLEIRIKELNGEAVEYPEDWYPGEYLIDCAKKYIETAATEDYAEFAKCEMLRLQKEFLKKFRVHFDCFFSELSLYSGGEVEKCLEKLEHSGKLFEKDGALWFKTTDFGDDQDRVIKKANGDNTYLTADIAYHYNKLQRGFDHLINIWGADHHGYVARMKAAVSALGYDSCRLEVLLGQLVNIIEQGDRVRMGKRKKMVTLEELVEDVGVDATRFWMLMRSIDTTLDFDIDLAKTQSDKNPVFYVQYAHARACSILRRALETRLDTETGTQSPALLNQAELEDYFKNPTFENLFDEKSKESIKKLVLRLEEYKSIVEGAAKARTPYLLCKYTQDLASDFHHFYNFTRVLDEDKNATLARLSIVESVRLVMSSALDLMGVEAVERM
ncbi:arginyl-tRNA synthetase [Candidatus Gastranaerophilus sp. (ex Termes propinquus)]|nr:arginyl-tRNA synthetase [Candidatus Gastranaerophilus sp. (ex Termes propinquus)]